MTPTKQWYTSAALWVNILSVLAVAIGLVLQQAGTLQLTAQQVAIVTIALGVVNAAIRVLVTNQPIKGSRAAHMLAKRRNHLYLGE